MIPTAIFNVIDPKRTCAGRTCSGPTSRLLQDDLDAPVLRLAHARRRGHERIGVAEVLDVDCGLQHAAANQFCLHGVRAAAVGVALHLVPGGLHPGGSRGSLGDDLPRAAGQVGTVPVKALVQE